MPGGAPPPDPAPRRPPERDRPRFTSRAAVLAVVMCAVALSLAYPIREYIAQRRQIDQLHLCMPGQTCYIVIGAQPAGRAAAAKRHAGTSWYDRLWTSVRQADQGTAR